ncbi:MAG: BrnT family toxin [Acidobacteria bacterium]|nr:BrnT family toxin [Acidobacteriota bacterium]
MDNISFDWDPRKARANLAKHGISFEEARTASYDDHAGIISARRATKQEDAIYWSQQ